MKDNLDPIRQVLGFAIEEKKRTQDFIKGVGPAIIEILTPIMEKMVENAKMTKEEMMACMSMMQINVAPATTPEAHVTVDIPPIKIPTPQVTVKVPEIKIPVIKVPKPEVTVNVDASDFTPLIKELKAMKPEKMDHSDITTLLQQLLDKEGIEIPPTIKLDKDQFGSLLAVNRVGGGGSLRTANKVTVKNLAMAAANTEYSYTFPANTLSWTIKLRATDIPMLASFTTGTLPTSGDGSSYITVPAYYLHSQQGVEWSHKTIYLQTEGTSQVAEIISYQM